MEPPAQSAHPAPSRWAAAAVVLCGICAFLDLYITQPLLPMLSRIFRASETATAATVSAATLGVALSAPVFGALTERLARKRVIVASLVGVAAPTLLAATSTSLHQLIFWRFLQGITLPGIFAVVVTYIGEEWPPYRIALIMSFYVSGTALGGLTGRLVSGIVADLLNWRASFLALGAASLLGAAAVAAWLPHGRSRPSSPQTASSRLGILVQVQQLFRIRPLVATFAIGFSVLFSLVGVFTWITYHLSSPPFRLSTTALSELFMVYAVGLLATPAAGYLITRVGLRAGIGGAIGCSIAGVLLTLAPSLAIILLGLALLATGVFVAQTATQSHLRIAAPAGARVTAAGLYVTCYYLGGTAAGVVPGIFWNLGRWPACVVFIVFMQVIALAIALIGWRGTSRIPAIGEPRTPQSEST
jgi:MFS transporter, YNFM family, putative membrane transport protein